MKYTEEYLRRICLEKDLEFKKIYFVETNGKKRKCLDFICNKHRKYGIQTRPVEKIDTTKKPCQYCNHSKLKMTFKDEVVSKNENIIVLGEYVNWDTSILCECKLHGEKWNGLPSVLLYGGTGCKTCIPIKRWDSRGRITTEEFKDRMKEVNPFIDIIGNYLGTHQPIQCKCKIHNYEWPSIACNLLNGTAGCPKCAEEKQHNAQILSDEDFKRRLNEIAPHIISLSKYDGNNIDMEFYCKEHDRKFFASPRKFLYKQGRGCPECFQSTGERRLINLLEEKGRNIILQYTFDDCRYKNVLRFDAYDVDNNIAYEYQGEQHYYPVNFNGEDLEQAKIDFKENQIRDKIKEEYCRKNNITLIKIPYWDFDDMEKYII